MNLFSILRLSLHNLWNNKLRTLLTVIVLTVVSFVVVLLAGVGYSFYKSLNANVSYMLKNETSNIEVGYHIVESNIWRNGYFTADQVEKILEILDNDDGYITSVGFMNESSYGGGFQYSASVSAYEDGSRNGNGVALTPFYGKSNPFIGVKGYENGGYLAGGRMWNASDVGTKNCWLEKSAMSKYEVGDEITLTRFEESNYGFNEPEAVWEETFTVCGFLDLNQSSSWQTRVFVDYKLFNEQKSTDYNSNYGDPNYNRMIISRVYAKMIPQEGFDYGVKTQKYLKNTVKKINAEIVPTESGAEMDTSCDILESMQMATLMSIVIIAFLVVVCLIIILLSIGSVANTIKISAEQNRKFFGVMKAIGMKNKSLRHILIGQIIIMTVLGVAIASLVSYLMVGVAESVIGSMIGSLFFNIDDPIVICGISPVIPFGIALLLIGFVLLFTRSSLHEFSRMDVISVINEVN